jgi:hypothetical protein
MPVKMACELITSAAEVVEKREPLHTVDGNAN